MLSQFNFKTQFNVVTSVFMARLKMISRYKGGILIEILIPTFLAAIPILLGRSLGGENIEENFLKNTGTANYVAYMVIGANIFMIVAGSLWNFGFWVRREQQTGTLESIYLTPTNKILILGGVAFYGAFRNIINFGIAFILGCYIFGVNPFQGNILVAILFLSFGLIPIYGLSFLYGALILKLKEANALIQLAQWIVAFLMGIYYPITVFPKFLRYLALTFPPTWMNNGIRASLLEVSYFFKTWYQDLAVLWVFCVVAPLLGYWVFLSTEKAIKKNEGVGKF